MSRWGKPTKNKKHRDPRYFLIEQDLFSPADGSLNKEYAIQLFVKAADGDKEAAKQLYASADIISKEYKFSPADGTKIESDAIAKAYGLDVGGKNTQQNNPMQNIQDMFTQQMAQIQNNFKKQQELINKQSQQFHNQQEDKLQQMMDKFKSEQQRNELYKQARKEENSSYNQTSDKFKELFRVLGNDREAMQLIEQNWKEWVEDRKKVDNEFERGKKEQEDYILKLQQQNFINKKWLNVLNNLIQKAKKGV